MEQEPDVQAEAASFIESLPEGAKEQTADDAVNALHRSIAGFSKVEGVGKNVQQTVEILRRNESDKFEVMVIRGEKLVGMEIEMDMPVVQPLTEQALRRFESHESTIIINNVESI